MNILDRSDYLHTEFLRSENIKEENQRTIILFKKLRKEYYQNIDNTDYTLCIRGTGNFSVQFYQTLALGRIPIFINTDCILPFEKEINWKLQQQLNLFMDFYQ